MNEILINHGLEILLAIVTAFLAKRGITLNRKAKALPSVIKAVEAYGNAQLKRTIKSQAAVDGVQAALHEEVQRVTEDHPVTSRFPLLGLCALGVLVSGCSTAGIARIAEQLKDDPAIVNAKVVTIYGTAHLTRIGGQTNTVSVSPDGTITVNRP